MADWQCGRPCCRCCSLWARPAAAPAESGAMYMYSGAMYSGGQGGDTWPLHVSRSVSVWSAWPILYISERHKGWNRCALMIWLPKFVLEGKQI